jgi:hypothetical protein
MKGPDLLRLITRHARAHGLEVQELPKRGKGSHRRYVVVDADGDVVARFGLTGHSQELSWTVLRSTEEAMAPLFGPKWMEES